MSSEQGENNTETTTETQPEQQQQQQQQQQEEVNGKPKNESSSSRKERPPKRGGGGRYEPYGNANKRYRVFVSNIPYDVKWQALKDLMKEKGLCVSILHLRSQLSSVNICW
ncbi:hypothetical protein ATANTOWER_017510 [Ataeniobius toweri]|uniref:RRM domain-containing protein n=1 Tax=Ataeniobius toweri TaxID=208326 RepID=A0ABU7BU08_9TELE|nr:hypothetical protein [Ataeniobius toweri]